MRILVSISLALAGCSAALPPAAPQYAADAAAPVVYAAVAPPRPSKAEAPRDAKPSPPAYIRLSTYFLTLPAGAVSNNAAFWQRVDEQAIDVATADTLQRNGLRAGVVPIDQWDAIRQLLAKYPAKEQYGDFADGGGRPLELQMRQDVEQQQLFYFDTAGVLRGRTFDAADNFFSVTFGPAPHLDDTARIAIVPVVRSKQERLAFDPWENARQLTVVRPEMLYALGLRADVRVGQFLVLAPSPAARWPTSLGHAFLTTDGHAEQMEEVLLFVPQKATPINIGAR